MAEREPAKVKWAAPEIKFCLIGYHGALFDIASVIVEKGLSVACVVSQMAEHDKIDASKAALARAGLFRPMMDVAERAGAPLIRLPDPSNPKSLARVRACGANIVLSVSAPILKRNFIDAFGGWVFNFHGSRHYRGRGGLSWNILNGLLSDSVVLHWIDTNIDTGDAVADAPYRWTEDAYPLDLFRAQRAGYKSLTATLLDMLADGTVTKVPQDSFRAYLPSLNTDEDGWIDWHWSPEDVERAVRAFGWPYGGASSLLESADRSPGTHIRIARCRVGDRPAIGLHPLAEGSVLAHDSRGGVDVACGGGVLHIQTLREGDGEIAAGERIRVGMRLRNRK